MSSKNLTYAGSDLLASLIAGQTSINVSGLLLRYAHTKAEAYTTGTNFGYTEDIKKVNIGDFLDSTGNACGAVIDINDVTFPLGTTSENYTGNKITYNFGFAVADLPEFIAETSKIYFMGLFDASNTTTISVLSLDDNEAFTISGLEQADIDYDLSMLA